MVLFFKCRHPEASPSLLAVTGHFVEASMLPWTPGSHAPKNVFWLFHWPYCPSVLPGCLLPCWLASNRQGGLVCWDDRLVSAHLWPDRCKPSLSPFLGIFTLASFQPWSIFWIPNLFIGNLGWISQASDWSYSFLPQAWSQTWSETFMPALSICAARKERFSIGMPPRECLARPLKVWDVDLIFFPKMLFRRPMWNLD